MENILQCLLFGFVALIVALYRLIADEGEHSKLWRPPDIASGGQRYSLWRPAVAPFGAITSNTTLPGSWPTHFGGPCGPAEDQFARPVVEAVLGSSQTRLAASAIASAALARSRIREAAARSRRVGLHGPSRPGPARFAPRPPSTRRKKQKRTGSHASHHRPPSRLLHAQLAGPRTHDGWTPVKRIFRGCRWGQDPRYRAALG